LYKKKKNQDQPGYSNIPECKGVQLSNCFAFKKGSRYSILLYNLALDEPRKVTLRLPYSPKSNARIYYITGNPRDRNNDAEVIKLQEKNISDFKNGWSFTLKPASAYVIVNSEK